MIYVLLSSLVILWWLVLFVRKDILCPSSIICVSYIVAIISSIYNLEYWHYNINNNTILIILLGIVVFLMVSFIINSINNYSITKKENNELKEIIIPKDLLFCLNSISFIILILYGYYFIKGIGGISNLNNISIVMRKYRYQLVDKEIEYIPSVINLLSKYCRALAFVSGFVLTNNLIYSKKNKKATKNVFQSVLSIVFYIPFSFMTASRFDLIAFVLAILMMWYILLKKTNDFKMNFNKILKICVLIIVIIIGFSKTRSMIGRQDESDTLSYFTSYFGGSIVMFDMYLQDDIYKDKDEYIGQELFSGLRKLLVQLKVLNEGSKNSTVGKFRASPNGIIIGNVYTAFRKMYNDFGIWGIIIFQSLMAIIYNDLYLKIMKRKTNNEIDLRIIIYSCIIFCIFFHSYSETFFSTIISFNYLMLFIMMYFITKIIKKVRIK